MAVYIVSLYIVASTGVGRTLTVSSLYRPLATAAAGDTGWSGDTETQAEIDRDRYTYTFQAM